ncbi:MAG TPA: 30S ribosomal protein S3 [Candidatus Bathyarchaeia archaeon]|nr:30S ribosomal protein S3 [Candidatus Bathyarchaeia archaeon]
MSVTKYFIKDMSRRLEIDELLQRDLKRAGYSKVELTKSPVGTRVVIYAAKPGMVIGRRGQSIKDLTKVLEEKFGIENAQLSVATIEVPEQDPKVVASQVAQALQRGVHFRRAAYWAIQRVMESKALGVEIVIRGKLTTERARYEKFRAGYLPRVGDPVLKSLKVAVADVQLKQGLFGIKVRILPPNVDFIDKPVMKEITEAVKSAPSSQPAIPAMEEAKPESESVDVETKQEAEPVANSPQA